MDPKIAILVLTVGQHRPKSDVLTEMISLNCSLWCSADWCQSKNDIRKAIYFIPVWCTTSIPNSSYFCWEMWQHFQWYLCL